MIGTDTVNFLVQDSVQELLGLDVQPVFENVLELLNYFGFFRFMLPFLLVFTIVYGILSKTKIFDGVENPKTVYAILALAVSFYVINYTPVLAAFAILIPQAGFLLVVAMLALLVLSFSGVQLFGTDPFKSNTAKWIFAILIFLVFLGMVDYSTGFQIPVIHQISGFFMGSSFGVDLSPGMLSQFLGLAILFGIPVIVFYIVMKGGSGKTVLPP
jgi:hypothetical protein